MMNKQQVLDAIDFLGRPEDVACCEKILTLLLQCNKRIYYYNDFLEVVSSLELQDPIQNVQRCLNLLKSKRAGWLRQEYRYLNDDGVVYDVGLEDLQAAHEDGALNLEWRNSPDYEYSSKVYIVFISTVEAA